MTGEVSPMYVQARTALLDVLEMLQDHRDSIVLVGAQAVYLWTGEGDLSTVPYTTDGDLAIDPRSILERPDLQKQMEKAGCQLTQQPGIWKTAADIQIDLLVPASLGGKGRRSAKLEHHGDRVARKVTGLEGVLVDVETKSISSLDEEDIRSFSIQVAGPAALLLAKMHKMHDRMDSTRMVDKDALDVFRILRSISSEELAKRLLGLQKHELSKKIFTDGWNWMNEYFSTKESLGCQSVARALEQTEDGENVEIACVHLMQALKNAMEKL